MDMDIEELIEDLYGGLKDSEFKGYDPYDGLSSRVFRNSLFFRSRALRLAWIQLFKRSPVNFRGPLLVPRGYNPKGLALMVRGLVELERASDGGRYLESALELAGIIYSQRANDRDYFCAGYNFFWEARAFSVPDFTPNMVVTSFAAQAFLDLYEAAGDEKWLEYATQAAKFMERELVIDESEEEMSFGYVPGKKVDVHNVNLMGAALMARLFSHTGEERYRDYSLKAARHSVLAQDERGAWRYGSNSHHGWVDNFHTGFNLLALKEVQKFLETDKWSDKIDAGLQYHADNHFEPDMTPRYYDHRLYPVDIHNFAQGIITFLAFGYSDKALKLIEKSVDMMWDSGRHYFYYQKKRTYTNRINYIRWSQAWMFYALAKYLKEAGR